MLQTHRVRTLDQVRSFLDGAESVEVQPLDRSARYEFVSRTLRRFGYWQLGKADKGAVRRFVRKVSGLSRAQLTRLIAQYRSTGRIRDRRGPPRRPFPRRYTREDIRLLTQVDVLHGTLSGPQPAFAPCPNARPEAPRTTPRRDSLPPSRRRLQPCQLSPIDYILDESHQPPARPG